jgi:hypothetical protein
VNVKQLTKAEAIAFAASGIWKEWTPEQRGIYQLYQERLCMDAAAFHEGIEAALGRPVWTHEFANQQALIDELEGKTQKATLSDVIGKLAPYTNKGVVVQT